MVGELKLRFKCSITSRFISHFLCPIDQSSGVMVTVRSRRLLRRRKIRKFWRTPCSIIKVDHDVQIITIYEELFLMEENK
jgi:hypothetical protein